MTRYDVQIARPKNGNGKSNLLKRFESYLEYAAIEPRCGAILVLIDSDDECPIVLAKGLAARCAASGTNKPIAIVCATREYESWLLASLNTVKGNSGVSELASFAGDVEGFRGVKGWLTSQMPPGRAYKETLDQAPLTSCIDLNLAHDNSRSFRRLCHAVEELLNALDEGETIITPQV